MRASSLALALATHRVDPADSVASIRAGSGSSLVIALYDIRDRMRTTADDVRRALDAGDEAAFGAAMAANDASFDALGELFVRVLRPSSRGGVDAASRAAAIEAALAVQAEHRVLGGIVSEARQRAALAVAGASRTVPDGYEAPVAGAALDRRG